MDTPGLGGHAAKLFQRAWYQCCVKRTVQGEVLGRCLLDVAVICRQAGAPNGAGLVMLGGGCLGSGLSAGNQTELTAQISMQQTCAGAAATQGCCQLPQPA